MSQSLPTLLLHYSISVFDREIKITQLADDTTLFLKDKNLLSKALELVEQFSCASGLNVNLCQFMIWMIYS